MKKLIVSTLSLLSFLLISMPVFSQGGGTKPELIMYRYNNYPTQPSPVLMGDLLGTLKWQGLTGFGNVGAVEAGASIQSFVKAPVSFGSLQANMIFRTSGSLGLTNRMIITQDGLVGIGTDNPIFHLDVVGNTHTSGDFFGRIHMDANPGNPGPDTYISEAYFENKSGADLVAPDLSRGGLLTLAPTGNTAGARDHQLFFNGGGIYNRTGDAAANNWAGAWEKLLTSGDISGTPNRVARFLPPGAVSSKLGDSQLFDDGTNVAIGGNPPAFDANYLLTVNGIPGGAARINGKTFINGRLGVANNTPSEALDVTGNTTVSGNSFVGGNLNVGTNAVKTNAFVSGKMGIGTTPSSFALDVNGESNFSSRVKIGAASFPTSTAYKLAVGGGIIAEEVLVQLQGDWADYVFEPNYTLMPLAEVEKYVRENKHLPGVTPAKELTESGLDLGEMQKVQMEKIEELFLHIMQQQKQIEQQQKTIERLENEINNLKK